MLQECDCPLCSVPEIDDIFMGSFLSGVCPCPVVAPSNPSFSRTEDRLLTSPALAPCLMENRSRLRPGRGEPSMPGAAPERCHRWQVAQALSHAVARLRAGRPRTHDDERVAAGHQHRAPGWRHPLERWPSKAASSTVQRDCSPSNPTERCSPTPFFVEKVRDIVGLYRPTTPSCHEGPGARMLPMLGYGLRPWHHHPVRRPDIATGSGHRPAKRHRQGVSRLAPHRRQPFDVHLIATTPPTRGQSLARNTTTTRPTPRSIGMPSGTPDRTSISVHPRPS